MRHFFLAIILVVASGSITPADSFDDAFSAYDREQYRKAALLFRPLAEQGNPEAQRFLGLLYAQGKGVPQVYILAHMWLNVAVGGLSGDDRKKAMRDRDQVESFMTDAQKEKAQEMAARCQQSDFQNCEK